MALARVFKFGNGQAVRLPKEFHLKTNQVEIFRRGDEIVLREVPQDAVAIFDLVGTLPPDFMEQGREDGSPQERDAF